MTSPFRSSKLAFVTRRQGMSDGSWRIQAMKQGDGKQESDWETIFMTHNEDDAKRFEVNAHGSIDPGMLGDVDPTKPKRKIEL